MHYQERQPRIPLSSLVTHITKKTGKDLDRPALAVAVEQYNQLLLKIQALYPDKPGIQKIALVMEPLSYGELSLLVKILSRLVASDPALSLLVEF